MIGSLRAPSTERRRQFLAAQAQATFTYPAVGATAGTPPAGFHVDHTRVTLGAGERTFAAAKAALARWEHFRLGWVEAWPDDTPIAAGENIVVVAREMGLWWMSACRIVYVIDESGPITRFGFAYGTLPNHPERGEERFQVEWNRADDVVSYDILAFSRPSQLLIWLAYPLMRRAQKRFARDSVATMQRAVEKGVRNQ